jgi:hypothetical protein
MARAVVVVESMFGNTEAVANAVADGVATRMPVDVVRVSDVPQVFGDDVALLVAGGPTHAFGLTRATTRRAAVEQGAPAPGGTEIGLREWMDHLTRRSADVAVAAFDTRIRKRGIPGSAARGALRRLRSFGFRVIAPAGSFFVTGTSGPLVEGELQRARDWGARLVSDEAAGDSGRS